MKVQGGVNICGSRNVIFMSGAVGKAGTERKLDCDTSEGAVAGNVKSGSEEGRLVAGRKRKNDEVSSVVVWDA